MKLVDLVDVSAPQPWHQYLKRIAALAAFAIVVPGGSLLAAVAIAKLYRPRANQWCRKNKALGGANG